MMEWIWSFCNKVWKGEGWPERWKEGAPVVKKKEGERVEDYKGVTLMPTLYKVRRSIGGEVEGKNRRKGNYFTESNKV